MIFKSKQIYIAVIILFSFSFLTAQVKDVTFKDVSGMNHNLYSYLEAGKYVLLDFMSEN